MYYGNAILPAGRINPSSPFETNEYDWTNGTVYLLARPGKRKPTLAVMSAGRTAHSEHGEWVEDGLGYRAEFYHDQTGAQKGEYVVVGIVDFDTAALDMPNYILKSEGTVPDASLSMAVYK